MKPIKLFWRARFVMGRRNFGDWISPELCRLLSGREVHYARPNRADLVAVGSILHRVPTHFWSRRISVWGTGFMETCRPARAIHHYHAVRGWRTAELLGVQGVAFGDPGLLVNLLLPGYAEATKRWELGLVPHHVDQAHPSVKAFLQNQPHVRLLDILGGTQEFLKDLAGCRFVLSSSLHGLVAADAFGIPNAWIKISDDVIGSGFKFHDYYSAFGNIRVVPLSLDKLNTTLIDQIAADYQRPGLNQIKSALMESFPFHR